jgi:ABC-type phosphate transport system ATPase subunit
MSDQTITNNIDRKDILFYIEKLSCAYIPGQPVLEARDLIIPKRKITVLLGPSGAGKSTLLETLGLMTKTVDKESSSIRFFPTDDVEYDLADIWGDDQKPTDITSGCCITALSFRVLTLCPILRHWRM